MNCPSRTEEPEGTGFNQNPSSLAADLTTRNDLNGIANARELRRISSNEIRTMEEQEPDGNLPNEKKMVVGEKEGAWRGTSGESGQDVVTGNGGGGVGGGKAFATFMKARNAIMTFAKFIGPGFMVS